MAEAGSGMPPDDAPVVMVADRFERAAAIAALVVAIGWHLANDLPATIDGWAGYRAPALVGAVWLGYLVIALAFGGAMLRGRAYGPVATTGAIPLLLLGSALTQYANGRAPMFAPANWGFAAVGWFALLVLWHRRLADLVAFCLANAAITLVALIHSGQAERIDVARFAMVSYGVSVLPIAIFVGGRVLTTTARRMAQTQHAQAQVDTLRLAAESAHQARAARFRSALHASAHLLAGLAGGELDLESPLTQQRCRAAAARLRRLIAETDEVPDPLVHELRACADTAERRGVEVDLVAIGTLPPLPVDVRRILTDLPIEVLATAHTRARITVVATPEDVAVAVLAESRLLPESGIPAAGAYPRAPAAGLADSASRVTASVEREGGQVWVQTRWQADQVPPDPAR